MFTLAGFYGSVDIGNKIKQVKKNKCDDIGDIVITDGIVSEDDSHGPGKSDTINSYN